MLLQDHCGILYILNLEVGGQEIGGSNRGESDGREIRDKWTSPRYKKKIKIIGFGYWLDGKGRVKKKERKLSKMTLKFKAFKI